MSTITKGFTKEQLIAKAEEQIKLTRGLNLTLSAKEHVDMCSVLFEIALASLEAEAVAYIIQDADARSRGEKGILRYFANISDEDINEYEITVTPLYAAPPAPVSVPDAMEMDDDFDSAFEHGKAVGWNAYRAAMLQSFGNSEQLNSPVIPDGWVACSERMPEQFKAILAFNEYGEVWSGAYDRYWNFYCDNLLVEHVTHWMPLPAAPQQEA
ncbi:DUF551 domain-containing protein [Enterobacter kobei]|uniref:DUF551 domain-containing protein n=1 Tax=Enterobacter kobei TaxID=208224 RepID=UPI0023AF6265|nr:DUF551 domain-containing protein [Enterobacter kobei]MDE7918168.1 DUF551 domain-containing protein [Enterobacter kobei]